MKKLNIFNICFILLFLSAFSISAQQVYVTSIAPKDASYLNINAEDSTLNFLAEAGNRTIEVKTNLDFSVKSDKSWCKASIVNGKIVIAVEKNEGEKERKAVVAMYGKDNNSRTINVVQLGTSPNILLNKKSIAIDHYQLEFSIGISSNVNFSFELPAWIKCSVVPKIGFQEYIFTVDPIDESTGERKGDIVLKSEGSVIEDVKIPVTQTHVGYPCFAVISDVHFGNSQGEGPMVKVPKALKNLTSHKELDAIFVVGDLTESGSTSQYTQFVQVFSNESNFTKPVDRKVYMMGNHDNYTNHDNYINGLKPLNNNQAYPLDQYIVIKGYPFITISQRNGSNTDAVTEANGTGAYPQAVQDTLRLWMARAAAECPGKPIFVFTHVPPKYTCYSSWPGEGDGTSWPTWSMKVLNPILNEYPQAVVFGGHSHFPIGDPRSIHQGVNPNSDKKNFFTGINTGSTTYSEIHRPSVDIGIHPERYDYVTEGMILTVQGSGDVLIQRYDTYRNVEMHPNKPWVLKAPHDGSMFEYADIRDAKDNVNNYPLRDGLPAPVFAGSAVVTLDNSAENAVTVTFPQATDNDYVFRYRINVKDREGKIVKEFYKFSQFYLTSDMPESLTATISGLSANTAYTVEVIAYDSYDNQSTPIVSEEFVTGVYEPAPGSSKPAASSILLDVVFNEDGTAKDASSLKNTITIGTTTPQTYMNETYNIQTAKFTGNSSCFYKVDYKNNAKIKEAFSNGFTFETVYMTNNTGNVCPMSAQESGGAGIEQASGGQLQFFVRIAGSWVTIKSSVTVKTGKYYHVVASYDKSKKKTYIYVDGVPAGELDAIGDFSFPVEAAQWIAIGGDASTGTTSQFSLNGEVVVSRMYNKAVTRDEVYWMHKDFDVEGGGPTDPETFILPTTFPQGKLVGHWIFDESGISKVKANSGISLTATSGSTGGITYVKENGINAAYVTNSEEEGPTPNYLTLSHNLPATTSGDTEVKDYCIVMDIKAALTTSYLPLLWSHSYSGDADIFVKQEGSIGLNGGGLGYTDAGFVQGGWNRVVINANLSNMKLDFYCMYPDGTIKKSERTLTDTSRFSLRTDSPSDIFKDDGNEDGDAHIAQLVLFKNYLSSEELNEILIKWTE